MGSKYYYGFVHPHTKNIEYLIRGHVPAFEINVSKLASGDNIFDQIYNHPRIGIGFYRANFNNSEVLGTANSLFSFMHIPIIRFSDNLILNCQISGGLSYLSKKFDLNENNLNIAIGSHFNLHFSAIMDMRIRISEKIEWTNGISFTHFSNGRVHMPNLGLNHQALFTGLSYVFEDPVQLPGKELPEFKGYFEYLVIISFGIKHRALINPEHSLINSVVLDVGRFIRPHIKFSAGFDYFYDGSIKIKFVETENEPGLFNLSRTGFHIGYHMRYKKFTLVINEGYYLFCGFNPPSPLYSRVGLQYRISKHLTGNVTLKAHHAVADFVEWGMGYVF